MGNPIVDTTDIAGGLTFPDFDPAGVHQFGGKAFGRGEQPPQKGFQPLRFLVLNRTHHVVIVAHQDIEALVETGCILKLLMGMPCREWRNCSIERSGIAQPPHV